MTHTRIIVAHYGGPDALRVIQEERPEPKVGEVRVKALAAGVSLPDVMAREGIHPETPPVPFTPGWDLVGVVDQLGEGASGVEPGQIVTALPIHGAYAEFVCLPLGELVPVPPELDAAEAVSLVLNYVTAYQMMHRSVHVKPRQRVLIHAQRVVSARRFCNSGSSQSLRCTGPVQRGQHRPFQNYAAPQLITSNRTSCRRSTASRMTVWMLSLIPLVVPISGSPAKLFVVAAA
jgi:hypothetical protein